MTFELTAALIDELVFAMENQTQEFCVDAANCRVVLKTEDVICDEEKFYSLPLWESADGFSLRENFTNGLHSPLAHADLKRALLSGRGVFRSFKEVLKSYPEVEKKWMFYKNVQMKKRIVEWYNALCETWGLDGIQTEENETQELVESDFVFSVYDPAKDLIVIREGKNILSDEIKNQFDGELGKAVACMSMKQSMLFNEESAGGYVCRSQDEDFAGCILYSACPLNTETSVALTDFFVCEKYRGLGIGKELLLKCCACLRQSGVRWILVSNILLPKSLKHLLEQSGFEKLGSGFVADIEKVFL